MKRHALIFGLVGGLLIATLQYTEYRFVVIEHSIELYGALVAILFATFGIWLGLRITRSRETIRETVVVREVHVPAETPTLEPFAPNAAQQQTLGITARELEILTLIARGFSNREIATQLFVSENTVKTHCARAFDKLGAARRTQAVQRGKELGLLQRVRMESRYGVTGPDVVILSDDFAGMERKSCFRVTRSRQQA